MSLNPVQIQEQYYNESASTYDQTHVGTGNDVEHDFSLCFLTSMIELYSIKSILDVGAGTGRTITYLKERYPNLIVYGIEPIAGLRQVAYDKGISETILRYGNGTEIEFGDASFDLVCEFAVLHHVERPAKMVEEMLRVAKKGIFISDTNGFGQGSAVSRTLKQILNKLKLWKAYNFIRTKGKNYQITIGDGLFYSYSVFNNYKQIRKACSTVHVVNTKDAGVNPYKTASHVALFGLKK